MTKKNTYFNFFLSLLIYLIILLIEGVSRLHFIQNETLKKIKFFTLSSNINMVITSLFSILIIIGILFILYNVKIIFNLNILIESIINALTKTVVVYAFMQAIKIVFNFYYFSNFDLIETNPESYLEELIKSDWYYYSMLINFLMYVIGVLVFFIVLTLRTTENLKDIVIISVCKFTCIVGVLLSQ